MENDKLFKRFMIFLIVFIVPVAALSFWIKDGVRGGSSESRAYELITTDPGIIAKYGSVFECKVNGGVETGEHARFITGDAAYGCKINENEEYEIFLKKKGNTDWYSRGLIEISAKYSCNEIPCYFVGDSFDKINGRMMIKNNMEEVVVDMNSGIVYFGKKIKNKKIKYIGDDIKEIISPKCVYDVDKFKVKLTKKEKERIGTTYNVLTFNKVKEDTGEKTAEKYLKDSFKLKKKYAAGYELRRTRGDYYGYIENGKLVEYRAWKYKINEREEYQVYMMKEEGKEWQVVGSICLSARYVSDDGKIWFENLEKYETNGEIITKYGIKEKVKISSNESNSDNVNMEMCVTFTGAKWKNKNCGFFCCDCKFDLDEFTATIDKDYEKYFGEYFKTIHFHEVTE
mgnify:CR=1 FL=1